MNKLKTWIRLIVMSAKEFSADNATKLSASLAYFTVFSIGPLLLIFLSLTGLFFERQAVTSGMVTQLRLLLGPQGASSVISMIDGMRAHPDATKFSIIGFAILLFGASKVFVEIQTSINYIWSIRSKPRRGWLKFIRDRLLSFSLIIGMSFLLMVSLMINMVTDALTYRLSGYFGETSTLVFKGISLLLLFVIIAVLFTVIYKVLPDAHIPWTDAAVGASLSAVLFMIGKFLIGYYLGNSNIASTYGAAASVIIILTWVYYSSMILYFGAEFTKVYCLNLGRRIRPYETAVYIVKEETHELPHRRQIHPESRKTQIDD